ncbi:AAA family ATPase [Thalassobacillus pellis]|uniref:AAA family ATPase n=1 Tax=Thalassobacillus pellis TaxID=748008 RepID=UPI00195FDFB9|nr:AAA family ATPase [Thalassobacillus pellis]MBM7553231.1 ATP-dependent 26S proteasome regulatory subunit [Thalassobacillus pellis]
MGYDSNFIVQMANLFRARFPFAYISTWEEDRVIDQLSYLSQAVEIIKTPRKLITWSQTEGIIENGIHKSKDTKSPHKALDFIENYKEPAIFIMKDFHIYFGAENRSADMSVIRKLRDLVPNLEKSLNPKNVVFTSPILCIPTELQKEITIVDFGLPTFHEIKEVLNDIIYANKNNERININLSEEEAERLAKAALGLTLQEAENAFALSMVGRGKLDVESVKDILAEKKQTIKKTGILEFIQDQPKLEEVGGLENIKRWLMKRDKSWLQSAEKYGLPSPKGVLITGVPGCGKSLIAKTISSMWHLPLLRLDMGKIFSGIVGSSEENMRKAIETAETLSPSILWIDEIEKGLGNTNTSGDSGTTTRIFGTFLTWLQEKTKPVFVIATANNIENLPPELLRKGRFDEIFFVDLPTRKERKIIFKIHLKKRLIHPDVKGSFNLNESTLDQLADQTEGFIGAEIEQVVISALFEAYSNDRSLELDDLMRVINNTVALSVTQSEQIREIREWANMRAVAATLQEDRSEYTETVSKSASNFNDSPLDDIKSTRGGRTIDF